MEEILKQILGELQTVNNRLDNLEKEFNNRFDSLEKGQDQLKDNLINGLGPYFEQIEKDVSVKIDEIKDTVEGQQRVIDILSSRSFKHESQIRDFKGILKNQ